MPKAKSNKEAKMMGGGLMVVLFLLVIGHTTNAAPYNGGYFHFDPSLPCGSYQNPFVERDLYFDYNTYAFSGMGSPRGRGMRRVKRAALSSSSPSDSEYYLVGAGGRAPAFGSPAAASWGPCDRPAYVFRPPPPMIPWQDPPPQNVFPPAVNYPSGDCCQFVENPCDCGGGGGYFYPTEGPHVDKPDKPNGDGGCPYEIPGWNRLGPDREIYLGAVGPTTWYGAEAKAKEQGPNAFLAEIESEKENGILKMLEKCYPPGTEVWIGANDLAFAGRLVWTDGREVGPYENLHETAYVAATAASRRCLVASLADGRWRRRDCADVTGASVEGRGDPAGPGGEGATEEPPAPTPTAFIAERNRRPPPPGLLAPTTTTTTKRPNPTPSRSTTSKPTPTPSSSSSSRVTPPSNLPKTTAIGGTPPPPV